MLDLGEFSESHPLVERDGSDVSSAYLKTDVLNPLFSKLRSHGGDQGGSNASSTMAWVYSYGDNMGLRAVRGSDSISNNFAAK
jgi:hypothetical protein